MLGDQAGEILPVLQEFLRQNKKRELSNWDKRLEMAHVMVETMLRMQGLLRNDITGLLFKQTNQFKVTNKMFAMRKSCLLMMFFALSLVSCSPLEITGGAYTPIQVEAWTPDPGYQTGLVWFYKPPEDDLLHLLPQRYDFFILTHRDEEERDRLRSLGVTHPIPNYLLFTQIHDPGDCEASPRGNQVAFLPGDFCRISSEHPDWFLLDMFGNRIVKDNYYNMDPGNPGFRAFWLERARQLQFHYGWQGVFIDNVESSLSKYLQNKSVPGKYLTDESFQHAVIGFLASLQGQNIGPIYANIISLQDQEVWLRYLEYFDGAMLENFAVDWKNSEISSSEWVSEMKMLLESQRMGKLLLLVSQGDRNDHQRQQFAYASYLLVNEGSSYFRYAHWSAYRELWWYDNYNINLGSPTTAAYQQGDKWVRLFEYGRVVVDPREKSAEIFISEPVH